MATSLASATGLVNGCAPNPAIPLRPLARRRKRRLTARQRAAMAQVMQLFVEDDLALGVSPTASFYCPACERERSRAGAVRYGRYLVCNLCATEFEIAMLTLGTLSIGQYVRDKRYGEGERYALPPSLLRQPDGIAPEWRRHPRAPVPMKRHLLPAATVDAARRVPQRGKLSCQQ